MYSTNALEVLAARIDVSPEELEQLSGVLDSAELRHAGGLPDAVRRLFVATRAILRTLLGERLGVPAAAVPLRKRENGKLFVSGGVLFNVAHSKDLAVFAFTHNLRVGVDVELLRPVNHLPGVVELAFAPSEAADLLAVPAGDRAAAFFSSWTRKEAYLKASGNGLGALQDVADPDRWELTSFEPGPGYVGAVAVERAA